MTTAKWPFWKTVPRFERPYGIAHLAQSLGALLGSRSVGIEVFCSLFPDVPAYFTRSAREGLYLVLKLLRLGTRSGVGVPLFCCGAVFEAIVAAGHIPVFVDIDPKTYNLDEVSLHRKREAIDALIVPHMFGYPADLDRLRNSLYGRKVPIIEDCAQALFSEYNGRATGSWTEASVLSFGLCKPAEAGGGGLLLLNDPDLAREAARELAHLRGQNRWRELCHALGIWARSVVYQRVAYGAALASPLSRFIDRNYAAAGGLKTDVAHLKWSPARIRRGNQVLVDSAVREFEGKLSALAEHTQRLRNAVEGSSLEIPCEPSYGKWNHFWIPVRYPNATQCEFGRRFMRSRRVDVALIWPYCVRVGRRFGYQDGCRQAEEAAQTVCRVPHHAWLSENEVEYICECLRGSVGRDRSRAYVSGA